MGETEDLQYETLLRRCEDALEFFRRAAASIRACEGIPVEALEQGVVEELVAALELFVSYGDVFAYRPREQNPHSVAQAAIARARGEERRGDNSNEGQGSRG